ncbi:hypothetical protein ACROYT_G043163 [Oculina patagonica]
MVRERTILEGKFHKKNKRNSVILAFGDEQLQKTRRNLSKQSFNMRTLLFICGILLFASLMNSSNGAPLGEEVEAGVCPDMENAQWKIGNCNQCYCRNKVVYCPSSCEQ